MASKLRELRQRRREERAQRRQLNEDRAQAALKRSEAQQEAWRENPNRGVFRVPELPPMYSRGTEIVSHYDDDYRTRRQASLSSGRKMRSGYNQPFINHEKHKVKAERAERKARQKANKKARR